MSDDALAFVGYRSTDRRTEIEAWNTRDQRAPYMMFLPDGRPAVKKMFRDFRAVPDHVPAVGDFVIVDLTRQRCAFLAVQRAKLIREALDSHVDRLWEDFRDLPFEDLCAYLVDQFEMEAEQGRGDVIEVTEEVARAHGWL